MFPLQGQVGRGFEHPGLVEGVPDHGGWLELNDLQGPFQLELFCDSVIP